MLLCRLVAGTAAGEYMVLEVPGTVTLECRSLLLWMWHQGDRWPCPLSGCISCFCRNFLSRPDSVFFFLSVDLLDPVVLLSAIVKAPYGSDRTLTKQAPFLMSC